MLFAACSDVYNLMEEDEEEEEDGTVTSGAQTPVTPKILMHPADDFPTTGHTSTQSDENVTQNYDRASTSTIVEESEDLQPSTDTRTSGNS